MSVGTRLVLRCGKSCGAAIDADVTIDVVGSRLTEAELDDALANSVRHLAGQLRWKHYGEAGGWVCPGCRP